IKAIYKPEQIIFHMIYHSNAFIDKTGHLRAWLPKYKIFDERVKNVNPFLEKVYDYCLSQLEGCHIIRWPDNVLADENHHLGIESLHYNGLYYDYAEQAISIITEKLDRYTEVNELKHLRELYSQKFATLRAESNYNTLREEKNKWLTYSNAFKKLAGNLVDVTDNERITLNLASFIKEQGAQHIAIYGYTDITKVLITLLRQTDIIIDYIVEDNLKLSENNIQLISRKASTYPKCDIMLVADVVSYNTVKEKLAHMNIAFPVYNAAEFIQSIPEHSLQIADFNKKISNMQADIDYANNQLHNLKIELQEANAKINSLNDEVTCYNVKLQDANTKIGILNDDVICLNKKLQDIRQSYSYRIGRCITFFPRKIKGLKKKQMN
ncbi:MAG: hypothetical protein LUD51_04435, partial [Clostridia bacterium]|nr:hypothetical protein [Clostridia bacterium]